MTGDNVEDLSSGAYRRPESLGDGSGFLYAEPSPSVIASSSTADSQFHNPRTTTGSTTYSPISPHRPLGNHNSQTVPSIHKSDGAIGAAAQYREEQHVTNETAAAFLSKEINGPGDALHLLFEAAGRTGDLNRHSIDRQNNKNSPLSNPATRIQNSTTAGRAKPGEHFVDPAITDQPLQTGQCYLEATPDLCAATQAWSRLRFVRAGWFTAQEAISYID